VSGTQTTVAILLRLNESLWTTTTGTTESRRRADRLSQIRPPDLTLRRSPFGALQHRAARGRGEVRVGVRLTGDKGVERGGDAVCRVTGDVLAHRAGIELAARLLEFARELIRFGEHVVRYRDGCLHTGSITALSSPPQPGHASSSASSHDEMAGPIRVYVDRPAEYAPRRRQTEGPTMNQLTHIGLDVHKDTIAVATLRPDTIECDERVIPNNPEAVRRLLSRYPTHRRFPPATRPARRVMTPTGSSPRSGSV